MNHLAYVVGASWVVTLVAYVLIPPLGVVLHLGAACLSFYASWAAYYAPIQEPAPTVPCELPCERPDPYEMLMATVQCSYCHTALQGPRCSTCGAPA